ncbi:MAG TPA: PAS domain S-box protein [Lacunisphaera sp.]|nr:PAS domain S-box protein [Lacunisphaera sp.]
MSSQDSRRARHPAAEALPTEALLTAVINSSDDAIVTSDLSGMITSWNPAAERIFGYPADEAIGQSATMLLPPDRADEETTIMGRVKNGERVEHFDTVRRRKDSALIDVSVTVFPIREADGRIIGASKIVRDITERRHGSRSELLLAAIVSSSDDAIASKNLDGIITSWNAGAQRIFGYAAEEIVGQSVLKLIPTERHHEEEEILARLRRGERVQLFETVRVRKNGEHFPVSLTISPMKDLQGRIIGASKIARDITEAKRITAEREQLLESERIARAQAEHANRMKDDFLATISHELRTPLNAIVGWAEVLKAASDPAEVAHGVEVIERNAHIQAQLIDDLLDLGRIASGKMTLNVEPVDLPAIVRQAVASVQHAANVKDIQVKTILHDARSTINGDAKRLQQIVWNLLANAVKFTPRGGRVIVTVARTNSHLDIVVADTGQGIDPKFMPHLFERFRQADASTTRQQGGLGIGLALVKQLVEMHAGIVRAESPGVGSGATFTVTLPVAASHAGASRGRPPPELTEPPVMVDLAGIKVLAVDDDRDSLDVICRILTGRNAEVKTAASAEAALKLFQDFSPDVVLSDIGMPHQDGYELIRRMRRIPKGETVPAAALTALARPDDRMRALQAGFQTHVAKPVSAAEVVAVVHSLASVHRPL